MVISLVSIIIPTYNRAKLLLECLKSILNQTYNNFEVLIIDDGSTDNTQLAVSDLDRRIIYHKLSKIGNISELRNYGIKHSNGEFIAFCDDDDIWCPDKLSIQLKLMNEYNITCTGASFIDSQGNCTNLSPILEFLNIKSLKTAHLFVRNCVITSTVLLRKTILEMEPFSFIKYKSTAEDYELWIKISLKNRIGYIGETLIKYRVHDNLTFEYNNLPLIYLNSIKIIKEYEPFVEKRYRKFALWGINKNRFEFIKLNLFRKNFFLIIKEIFRMMYDFCNMGFLRLAILKVIHPKRRVLDLIN